MYVGAKTFADASCKPSECRQLASLGEGQLDLAPDQSSSSGLTSADTCLSQSSTKPTLLGKTTDPDPYSKSELCGKESSPRLGAKMHGIRMDLSQDLKVPRPSATQSPMTSEDAVGKSTSTGNAISATAKSQWSTSANISNEPSERLQLAPFGKGQLDSAQDQSSSSLTSADTCSSQSSPSPASLGRVIDLEPHLKSNCDKTKIVGTDVSPDLELSRARGIRTPETSEDAVGKSTSISSAIMAAAARRFSKLSVSVSSTSVRESVVELAQGQASRSDDAMRMIAAALHGEAFESGTSVRCVLIACRPLIGFAFALSFVILTSNTIKLDEPVSHPDRWYQCLFRCVLWMASLACFATIFFNAVLTGEYANLVLMQMFLALSICIVIFLALWAILWAIWVHICKWPYPAPLQYIIPGLIATAACFALLWFSLPPAWQHDQSFRCRAAWLLATWCSMVLTFIAYLVIGVLIVHAPSEYDWVVATTCLNLLREAALSISKCCICRASAHDARAPVLTGLYIDMLHTLLLSTLLDSTMSWQATTALLAVDFIRNVHSGLRVLRWHADTPSNEPSATIAMTAANTLLAEELQLVLPPVYLCCRLLLSQGPNAKTTGNVEADQWQYKPVTDWDAVCLGTAMIVGVDAMSFVIVKAHAWCKSSPVSHWQLHLALQSEFGHYITFLVICVLDFMICVASLACAVDMTFTFEWLHEG